MALGLGFIKSTFEAVTGIVKEPIKGWQERKTLRAKSKIQVEKYHAMAEVHKAKAVLRMAENGQQITADWDARAQEQMKFTWKDELLLLVIVFPFIGSFIPGVQDYMAAGWTYVTQAPIWWRVAFLGVIAAVFGLRWLIAPLVQKWIGQGSKKSSGQVPAGS